MKTSDLHLSAFLLALDYELLRLEGSGPRREFVFAAVPEDVVVAFYSGRVPVDARKLLGALRDLKGLAVQTF